MDSETLKQKLIARRRAMESTMHTTTASSVHEDSNLIDGSDDDDETVIPTIGDDIVEEVSTHELHDKIEKRHEAVRRRLETSAIETKPSPMSSPRDGNLQQTTMDSSLSLSQIPSDSMQDMSTRSPLGTQSSMHTSLRSRLKAKLAAAKEQRGISPSGEEIRAKTKRLRDRMSVSTRFDDPLRLLSRPDLEKERELESKVAAKLQWKKSLERVRTQSGQPTETECVDFFMKQYEETPAEEEEIEPPVSQQPAESPAQADATAEVAEQVAGDTPAEERKKLIEEVVPRELDWKLVNITASQYISYRDRLAHEKIVNYLPSRLTVLPESKLLVEGSLRQPLFLEDEGFYVGRASEIRITNRNILENRILKQAEEGRAWFGPSGTITHLPNPIRTSYIKPWVSGLDDMDPAIKTYYVKAFETAVEDYYRGTEEYELQVDVGTLVFHHHALMSREHVLASNMSELYDAYIRHKHKNYAVFYTEKLQALRLAVKTMKRNSSFLNNDDISKEELNTRIADYIIEIRRTTRQHDAAEAYERELMRNIISEWNEIKSLRIAQGFSNTTIKLTVKRQEIRSDADNKDWMKEMETRLEECREEHHYTVVLHHKKDMEKYRENMRIWRKNKKTMEPEPESDSKDDFIDDISNFGAKRASTKPVKPVPPKKFDDNRMRNEIVNQALQQRRNPGEPKVSLEVTHTGTVTPNSQVPEGELSRRNVVQGTAMLSKVIINGRVVCTSENSTLTSDFKVHVGHVYKIRIIQWPDTLKIQLYEAGFVNNSLYAEIELAIPDGSINSANAQLFPVEISNDRVLSFQHEGVGSSSPFILRSNTNVPIVLKSRGQLFCSVAWGLNPDGKVMAPRLFMQHGPGLETAKNVYAEPQVNQVSVVGSTNLQDPDAAAQWSQEGKLDPNDPSNSALITTVHVKDGFTPFEDYFRLDQLQEEFNFVTDFELEASQRLRLLEYRYKEVMEFRNMRMVPAHDYEVLDSAFTAYERRLKEKVSLAEVGEKKVFAGTLSAHRLEVLKFRQHVRDSVLRRFFSERHHHTWLDMVREDKVPDIGTFGVTVVKAFEPRRPLKPIRSDRKKATAQNLTEGSVSLLVTVVRAYNLPVRDRQRPEARTEGLPASILNRTMPQSNKDKETLDLAPFVSVSFQGNVKATNVAQGPSPTWNEKIDLPFSAPNNDYSTGSLQTVDDTLFIHIFDRVLFDASEDTRDRNEIGDSSGVASGVISHRIHNYWLGSIKIPFSTVYQQGKIEGTFKINVPLVMLGYNPERPPSKSSDPYLQMESQLLQPSEGSYLTVFITLEPELTQPEPVRQRFQTQEDESLILKSLQFTEECMKKFPTRPIKTTVIDIKGESVFLTRYIEPLKPPPELLEGSSPNSLVTAEALARFVSLIPFVSDSIAFAGICDLWSTCDQFIQMLCGDEEEHALLLLNYFLFIGKEAYLVLGQAVPEGQTAYVLTREQSQEFLLWNASTGQHYKTNNYLCPLQRVSALANQDNIWFNMQTHDVPFQVNFNVRSAAWKPFFKTPAASKLTSVQPQSLDYRTTDLVYVRSLEERIERSLKDAVMQMRPRHVTRWNRSCSSALQQILTQLEGERRKSGTSRELTSTTSRTSLLQGDHSHHLSRLIGNAKFVGFPMDLPFTDIETIIKAVRSTEVHKIQDKDIEFALAVHIHAYPASVLCVWVYVAAINNTRSLD